MIRQQQWEASGNHEPLPTRATFTIDGKGSKDLFKAVEALSTDPDAVTAGYTRRVGRGTSPRMLPAANRRSASCCFVKATPLW